MDANTSTEAKLTLKQVEELSTKVKEYCKRVEVFVNRIFVLELLLTLFTVIMSAFRVNPYLLRVIIGKRDLRANQPTAMTAFLIARYLRTSSFIILIDMISYMNIILLILDLLYGLYLWKKTKYEILLIDKIQTNILIKNIIKSLCILPISSYGNRSNQIEQSLSNLIQIQNHIQNQINQSNNTITTLNYIYEEE
ncbi:hypothetical protein RFI_34218, partial [Reticulomyxa filosa]